ncbi:nSTAND1 domain-containing NTPase [Micromonospora sp. URMC 107]|uniref:nSTAND1 domain-containing NTPase n=1 Tax=Micromonospora sp. URMC 107 TaxID=3423418 RepID=UPI003F1ACED7
MGRRERALDPDADPIQRFAVDLRHLRRRAGLTYQEMSGLANYSVTALSQAAGGRDLPTASVLRAYVRACGGDENAWTRRLLTLTASVPTNRRETVGAEPRTPPYLGMETYQPEDRDRFFGRERLVAQLLDRLDTQPFLAVFGPSGSGKSSLLRAGMIGTIRADDAPAGRHRVALLLTPGQQPLRALASSLAALAELPPAAVLADLERDPAGADLLVRTALAGRSQGTEVVLVVDQFEEVFTLCGDARQRDRFITALLGIALRPHCPGRVVLGVRADFYGHCASDRTLLDALQDRQFLVGQMSTDELRTVVTEPARRAGLRVESTLVAAVVADLRAGGGPGALPHLSHALLETWRHRHGDKLTLDAYQAAGGLSGAIAQTADHLYDNLDEPGRRTARWILLRLTVGEGGEATRRPVDRAELTAGPDGQRAVDTVLTALTAARLVSVTDDRVQLAHEALLHAWPTFQTWLTDDRDDLRLQRRLSHAAAEWATHDRDAGFLWRGSRLAVAWQWTQAHPEAVNEREREFLVASGALERDELNTSRRQNRRLAVLAATLAALVLLAATATAIAVDQRRTLARERDRATAEKLAVQAASSPHPLALLLSMESLRLNPSDRGRAALLHGVLRPQRNTTTLTGHTGSVHAVVLSADGRTVVSAGDDRTVRRWDVATGAPVGAPLTGHTGPVEGLATSPDGTIVSGGDDGTIRRWDGTTGEPLGEPIRGHSDNVKSVAISADAAMIVSGGKDRTVRRWHAATGAALGPPLVGHTDHVWSVAMGADRRFIVSAGWDHTVRRWDSDTGRQIGAPLRGHLGPVLDVAVHTGSSLIVSGGQDGTVRRWNAASGTPVGTPLTGHSAPVDAVAVTPDGKTIISAGRDRTVRLWNARTGAPLDAPLLGHRDQVRFVAVSRDGGTVATAGRDRTIRLWRTEPGAPIGPTLRGVKDQFARVAAHPRQAMIASGHGDGTVRRWHAVTGEPIGAPLAGHGDQVTSVAFSPDGRRIYSASQDGTLRRWDAATGAPIGAASRGHTAEVASVAVDPTGAMVATAGWDGTVRRWDAETGAPLGPPLLGHTDTVNTVLFAQGGAMIVSAGHDGTIRRWDTRTGTARGGPLLAGAPVEALAVSPDGTVIAAGSAPNAVRRWKAESGSEVGEPLVGHHETVTQVTFDPRGRTISAVDRDGVIIRWDVGTGRRAGPPLSGYVDHVGRVAFVPGTAAVAVARPDQTIQIFSTDVRQWADHACAIAGRNLTPAEWNRYVGHGQPYHRTCARFPVPTGP